MSARALRTSAAQLWQHPWSLLSFSAATCCLHLLGWGLFASAEQAGSAVLNTSAHLLGFALYFGSLIWMVDGFTRAGLCLAAGEEPRREDLFRWHGNSSWQLCRGLLLLAGLISLILFSGFGLWSVVVLLLPAVAPLVAGLVLLLAASLGLSQIFLACWIVAENLGPWAAIQRGGAGFLRRRSQLLGLAGLLLLIALAPMGLGLVAEVMLEGLGLPVTTVALVIALPLLATTVTNSFVNARR